MWKPILAVAAGSAVGGLLRWGLSQKLNGLWVQLPPGTLVSNLIAGYIVGLAVAWLMNAPALSPEWRLLIITGFCGGLSTFSTFSVEILALLQRGHYFLALGGVALHLFGSLAMTAAGIATTVWLRSP